MCARSPVLNQSGPTEFVFRVFTTVPELQVLLFALFLVLYLTILCGNTAIIWVVCTHCSLHTPMYFFLCNLSFLEICYTTVVVPLMLSNILGAQKPIPLAGLFSLGLKRSRFSFLHNPEARAQTSDTSRKRWRASPEPLTCPGAGRRGAQGAVGLSQRPKDPGTTKGRGVPNPSGPAPARLRPLPLSASPSPLHCVKNPGKALL